MTHWIALLRAVNVGGTGKLEMAALRALCADAGFEDARTYIASGNVVFRSGLDEAGVRATLEARLAALAGPRIPVLVRSPEELRALIAANPFADAPGAQVAVLFTDADLPIDPYTGVTGRADEVIVAGPRALFIHYPSGMGRSRLRIPAEKTGTVRNMNTVTKLAAMAGTQSGAAAG